LAQDLELEAQQEVREGVSRILWPVESRRLQKALELMVVWLLLA
jgi:hypothetical protein